MRGRAHVSGVHSRALWGPCPALCAPRPSRPPAAAPATPAPRRPPLARSSPATPQSPPPPSLRPRAARAGHLLEAQGQVRGAGPARVARVRARGGDNRGRGVPTLVERPAGLG